MTTVNSARIVDDYLTRLDAAGATAGLPPARRAELVADIREHVHVALGRADGGDDEVAVRNVLERLGPPEEIAAAAVEPTAPSPSAPERRRVGVLEVAALLTLLVPFVGWAIGGILVLLSGAWTGRDKLTALLLASLAFVLPLLATLLAPAGSGPGPWENALLGAFGFLGGPIAALWLAWRLRPQAGR